MTLLGRRPALRVGDLVEIRSAEEILTTLDAHGRLDGQPFMLEMLQFCGRQFRVSASAHKTCDTVDGSGARRMVETVHLEGLRCDGSGHGGCQAECLLFWKEAWLDRVTASGRRASEPPADPPPAACTLERLDKASSRTDDEGGIRYSCQATQLPEASFPVNPMDPRPYWRDWRSGNVGLGELANAFFFRLVANTIRYRGYRLLIGLYDAVQRRIGGIPYPVIRGRVTGRTPRVELGLQPGDRVRVKSLEEIEETVDARQRNRGLRFDWEMASHCGKTMVVHGRIERIINEKTGQMMTFSNPCITLEGGVCLSRFSDRGRINCPRAIYAYFRENWLERADEVPAVSGSARGTAEPTRPGSA